MFQMRNIENSFQCTLLSGCLLICDRLRWLLRYDIRSLWRYDINMKLVCMWDFDISHMCRNSNMHAHLSCGARGVNFGQSLMRRSRKFCQSMSNCDNIFCSCFFNCWGEGVSKYHYNRATIVSPAKCHSNGVLLAWWWWPNIECWPGSFVIFKGSGPVLLSNPIFLWFFRGVWTPIPHPPLYPCMSLYLRSSFKYASSDGSRKTSHLCTLIWAHAACICDKYQNLTWKLKIRG